MPWSAPDDCIDDDEYHRSIDALVDAIGDADAADSRHEADQERWQDMEARHHRRAPTARRARVHVTVEGAPLAMRHALAALFRSSAGITWEWHTDRGPWDDRTSVAHGLASVTLPDEDEDR